MDLFAHIEKYDSGYSSRNTQTNESYTCLLGNIRNEKHDTKFKILSSIN